MISFVISFLIFGFIVILTGFIIFGIIYKPIMKQIFLDPGSKKVNPICQREKTTCSSDDDCVKCSDNEKMTCQELKRSALQAPLYGETAKYCLPVNPEQNCNAKNGGIWTWTGWANTNRMEWDCLCTYPQIAGGNGCEELNPNVCNTGNPDKPGNWSYNAANAITAPKSTDCTCPTGYNLLSTQPNDVPLCIPGDPYLCKGSEYDTDINKDKKMCESMYSNSTFIR